MGKCAQKEYTTGGREGSVEEGGRSVMISCPDFESWTCRSSTIGPVDAKRLWISW